MASSSLQGWSTSFEIAKAEGMSPDSEMFKEMLQLFETRGSEFWPDEGMHGIYKKMNLPGYYYNKEGLTSKKHEETNSDEMATASTGTLGKKVCVQIYCQLILLFARLFFKLTCLTPKLLAGQVRHFGWGPA